MNAQQSFIITDSLTKAIAIMDEKGRANEEYNSYMLWFEDWNALRTHILHTLETIKRCEVD